MVCKFDQFLEIMQHSDILYRRIIPTLSIDAFAKYMSTKELLHLDNNYHIMIISYTYY